MTKMGQDAATKMILALPQNKRDVSKTDVNSSNKVGKGDDDKSRGYAI